MGGTKEHLARYFISQFTDGTPVELIHQNYGNDVVTGLIYDDHYHYIEIK